MVPKGLANRVTKAAAWLECEAAPARGFVPLRAEAHSERLVVISLLDSMLIAYVGTYFVDICDSRGPPAL